MKFDILDKFIADVECMLILSEDMLQRKGVGQVKRFLL